MKNPKTINPLSQTNSMTGLNKLIVESRAAKIIALSLGLTYVNASAIAREQHDAHTHGVANMTLVSEGGILEVQFESPAISILGFEHKPKTEEQNKAIEKAKALLSSSTNILTMKGTSCSPKSANVEIHGPAGQTPEDHHDHAGEEHGKHQEESGHHDEHDHFDEKNSQHDHHKKKSDHHDEHADHGHHQAENDHHESHEKHEHSKEGHGENDQPNESHSEVSASYVFDCANSIKLKSVTISLFEHYSSLEKIKVNWVTETQQGESVLSSKSSTIELK